MGRMRQKAPWSSPSKNYGMKKGRQREKKKKERRKGETGKMEEEKRKGLI